MPFPIDEKHISAVEAQIGWQFPSDLRQRLLWNNGGEITANDDVWTLYPIWDPSDQKRMKRTINHVLHETQVARQWPNFPADALAIAENGGGDRLIVRPNAPRIEWWDHETGITEPVTIDTILALLTI